LACRDREAEFCHYLSKEAAVKVHVKNTGKHSLPKYETAGAAALDVRANLDAPVVLGSLERALVPTGLQVAVPEGHEAQVRPRSGLAFKHGVTVANAPGTIDSDYRGEIGVILVNLSKEPYTVEDGDRIAQLVVAPVEQVELELVEELDETARAGGGFGHTGRR
jgi:dUTP pyrophosphatase